MSVNLLLEDDEAPVVWRGPVISGVVKQFWHEVIWGDLDYMFIDMPPGTGDVPLTVFQSIPLDGIVIVTTPQDLVSMIVKKAYNMAKLMNIPVLGIVENMSYVECPDCGKKIYVFGEGKSEKTAEELGLPLLAQLPINTDVAELVDRGEVEDVDTLDLFIALRKIEEILG
jgi:Mrp family chromosome partitioning ATPase